MNQRRPGAWIACSILVLSVLSAHAGSTEALTAQILKSSPRAVVDSQSKNAVVVEGKWNKGLWSGIIRNTSDRPVSVREIVYFEGEHGLDPRTPVYGESFQMLAQITGTLEKPQDLGKYTDRRHYRIPEADGYRVASGLLTLSPADDEVLALAFTSCNKFIGRIGFQKSRLKVYLETEGLALPPHATWNLESFGVFSGKDRNDVLARVARQLQKNHPRALPESPPTGWCSWYTFYEDVTVPDIERNLAFAKKNLPGLRYIQIDDGYQAKMGDWLETGKAFGGNIQSVIQQIRKSGFEPALWVAPFIAEKTSLIFQQHPDWFVKGSDGKPLNSGKIGFGGWRKGPWFVLDGTNPEVQSHLEHVFKTMREEWGVKYFKLDANYWGAIHGGKHFDPNATRIDAYRQGMKAVQKGAGDAFLLGCNAPIWPSLGMVDGMRTSGDINHHWSAFRSCGLENLSRGWQNGKLWWNDPDCVVLTGNTQQNIRKRRPPMDPTLSDNEFKLHVASIRAVGGLVVSGDDLPQIPANRLAVLKKLLSSNVAPMHFEASDFSVGRAPRDNSTEEVALFNWEAKPARRSIGIQAGSTVTDFWTGESKKIDGETLGYDIPPHSAVLLEIKKP